MHYGSTGTDFLRIHSGYAITQIKHRHIVILEDVLQYSYAALGMVTEKQESNVKK